MAKVAIQGGVKNYLPSKEVTVPVEAKSSKNHVKAHLAYITDKEQKLLLKENLHGSLKGKPNRGPGGLPSLQGDFGTPGGYIGGGDLSQAEQTGTYGYGPGATATPESEGIRAGYIAAGGDTGTTVKKSKKAVKKQVKEIKKASKTRKATQRKKKWFEKNKQKKYKAYIDEHNLTEEQIDELVGKGRDLTYMDLQSMLGDPGNRGAWGKTYNQSLMEIEPSKRTKPHSNPLGLMYNQTDPQSRIEFPGWIGKLQGEPTFDNFKSGLNRISHMNSVLDQDVVTQKDITNYLNLTSGKGGTSYDNKTIKPLFGLTGNESNADFNTTPITYPGFNDPDEEVEEDTGPEYRFGTGQDVGRDVTLGYAANGGRISRANGGIMGTRARKAFGGIMDRVTGRRAYGLGSIFKSVKNVVSKVLKSPIGKAAIMYAGGVYLGGGNIFSASAYNPANFMGDKGYFSKMGSATGIGRGLKSLSKGMFTPVDSETSFMDKALKFGKWGLLGYGLSKTPLGKAKPNETSFADRGGHLIDPLTGQPAKPAEMRASLNNALENADGDPIRIKQINDAYAFLGPDVRLGTHLPYETYGVKDGGRIGKAEGGLMDLGGMEKDYRAEGGFVPIGAKEKADDVPARLSVNEFVFTADAVRGAGGGDIDKGAEIMENMMVNLEKGGTVSEESQGNAGAQQMFSVSERLGEVI